MSAKGKSRYKGKKKKYLMIGKLRKLFITDQMKESILSRIQYDETSKSMLRWKDNDLVSKKVRGKPVYSSIKGTTTTNDYSYFKFLFEGKIYELSVARVVYLLVHGDPGNSKLVIDHKDGNSQNNKISNLDLTTISKNSINTCKRSSCHGFRSVSLQHRKEGRLVFRAEFSYKRKRFMTTTTTSPHHAFVLGWTLITSGAVPIEIVQAMPVQYADGTLLKLALKLCKKDKLKPYVKFFNLHDYLASL